MKILFVENNDITLRSFRKELLDTLIDDGHKVCLVGEFGPKTIEEYNRKTNLILVKTDLKSKSLIKNYILIRTYKNIIESFKPEILLSFTIKPNLYCNLKKHDFFSVANITGLGTSFDKKRLLNSIVLRLYKKSFKNVDFVMFQNKGALEAFNRNNIMINSYAIIPGSGVNEKVFPLQPLDNHDGIRFLYPSRFIKTKGFYLLAEACPQVIEKYPNTHFIFAGYGDKKGINILSFLKKQYPNNISVVTFTENISEIYKKADFIVSPSFYNEGISNVLLESLSMGRPIITTNDNYGCKEVLQEGINGYGVKSNNLESLLAALEKAVLTSKDEIKRMGESGHNFVIKNFNRKTTIETYRKIINLKD